MIYLKSFTLASCSDEDNFCLNFPPQFEMQCYNNNNAYPFKIFPQKGLEKLDFEPITLLYGSNGSGKSTILNLIAKKLEMSHTSLANSTPCVQDYLALCGAELGVRVEKIPTESKIITSDDVFDFLQEIRAINDGIDRERNRLFEEYRSIRETPISDNPFTSLDDLEELKRRNDAKRSTKSDYVKRRIPKELIGKSNGESAFIYFTDRIKDNALYLLDEPENSLSPKLQRELASFIEDSARFYSCQFIISTHSPFLLSMRSAAIYDLDTNPVSRREWYELESVREYYDLFNNNRHRFEGN